jgi:hypothetical protein
MPEQTFLKRKHINAQQAYKKMLTITNHQGNANQNKMKYCLIPTKMAIIKKTKDDYGEGCRGKGSLAHSGWECKLYDHHGKQYRCCSRKLTILLPGGMDNSFL